MKPLYTLFVVAIPSFFIWFFLGKDFIPKEESGQPKFEPPLGIWFNVLIAVSFMISVTLITLFLIYFKILEMSVMTFVIPIMICFMAIFLSSWLNQGNDQWYRALIIIPLVFIVIPINILVNKYERTKIIRMKIKKENK